MSSKESKLYIFVNISKLKLFFCSNKTTLSGVFAENDHGPSFFEDIWNLKNIMGGGGESNYQALKVIDTDWKGICSSTVMYLRL